MKLFASLLSLGFLVSCGQDAQETVQPKAELQVISGDEASAIEASTKNLPTTVISRIPVINGELQFDKAEVVSLDKSVDNAEDALVSAFNASADRSEAVAELDADTSSDSHYRYRYRSTTWGYGWGSSRGCGWGGCGAQRAVYYGQSYSYSGYTRAAYRPYSYNYGCQTGGYYYSSYSYSQNSSWYSYGNPGCSGYACSSYNYSYNSYGYGW